MDTCYGYIYLFLFCIDLLLNIGVNWTKAKSTSIRLLLLINFDVNFLPLSFISFTRKDLPKDGNEKKGVWYLCPAWTVAIHHSWWLHFNSIETDRRFKQTEWDTKQRESSVSSIPFSLVYYIQNDNWQTLAAISARRSNAYPSHSKGKSTFDRSNAMSFLALLTFLISSE